MDVIMINSELGHCKTVEEFNNEIRRQQEEAHGAEYCSIHDAIKKYSWGCDAYMELGTHQGGTASKAMLSGFSKIHLVDMDMSRYNKFLKPLAEQHCKDNDIDLKVVQTDSTGLGALGHSDMLMIDSYHHPTHMMKELDLHGGTVRKYILAHDTAIVNGRPNDSLFQVMRHWAHANRWEVLEHNVNNVGYTVIGKR